MAPAMSDHVVPPSLLCCHWTVGAGDPVAAASKVAAVPAFTIWSRGSSVTTGGVWTGPQGEEGEAVFRGLGVPMAKSALFASVSEQLSAPRSAAVVLERLAVGPAPSKQLVPAP